MNMTSREDIEESYIVPEEADPDKYIIATYHLKTSRIPVRRAAEEVAIECSTGTWTKVKYETPVLREKYGAKVLSVMSTENGEAFARIAYPVANYDPHYGSVEGVITGIAGNVFDSRVLDSLKLIDIELPKSFIKDFPGPQHGPDGSREAAGIPGSKRPMIGTIIKPNLGLDPKSLSKLCYEVALGGLDLIKDDEDLINPSYCRLEDRTTQVYEALDRAKEETGKTPLYAVNVTARPDKILELADVAIKSGAKCLMLDMGWTMWSSIRALAEDVSTSKVPLHIHRAGHGAYTRSKKFGLSEVVVSKLCRLCGADQLHMGTVAGKFVDHISEKRECVKVLTKRWYDIKPTMPNASAAMHPGNVEVNVAVMGKNISILAGGGIHGHPDGTTAGARAMVQAAEAVEKGIPIPEYAKEHRELARALGKWGYVDPEEYLKGKI